MEGTFFIPEGYWEYNVAYDNSWNENYGQTENRVEIVTGNIRTYLKVIKK